MNNLNEFYKLNTLSLKVFLYFTFYAFFKKNLSYSCWFLQHHHPSFKKFDLRTSVKHFV